MKKRLKKTLEEIYQRLYSFFGPQNWWPAESPFEVCVGAILTQNASWKNVERAIHNLKEKGLLDPKVLHQISREELAQLIRSCGFYNLKARRLKEFVRFLIERYQGDLEKLLSQPLEKARQELLSVKGLGKETVDSILLYAGNHPIFVVDSYTYRILSRHHLIPEEITYEEMQSLFMENLPQDPKLYNEYHALLVACGKTFCKNKKPLCDSCPLKDLLWS